MLIDTANIEVRAGKGGGGMVSFRREKYVPRGGPDGGDGGNGGSVILVAEPGVDTLLDFAGRHHWFAENGEPGRTKQQHGRNGADLLVRLPTGTLVYDADSGELLADLADPGERVAIAKGGRGGFGNEHFKSPTNQVPRESTPGEPGESRYLRLELKLIADVGLIGLPNAGKSTLLSAISKARPKIADYPFTTLEPNLGIAELPGRTAGVPRRIVFADLPGLIEGAARGAGLGARFLRHVERTRLLVHLLDVEPTDGSDPVENYHTVRRELAGYSQALADKPELIALSKMDQHPTEADRGAAIELIEAALGKPTFAISSVARMGLNELLEACWSHLGKGQTVAKWEV